jgi:hypothetical protein
LVFGAAFFDFELVLRGFPVAVTAKVARRAWMDANAGSMVVAAWD